MKAARALPALALLGLALGAARPAAAHVDTRSFLVTGDAEAVLVITVPWVVTVHWDNSATLWRDGGAQSLTYDVECDAREFDWQALDPGERPLPAWLRGGEEAGEQQAQIAAFFCGGERAYAAPPLNRRMDAEAAARHFRALVAAGLRPEAARTIAVAGPRDPALIDALTEADIDGGDIDEARARARAVILPE